MFEAVQVRERQAVDLPSGSTVITEQVITEQMVTEPAAPHGGLRLPGPKGSVPKATAERPAGWPVCAGHFSPPPVLVGWGQDDGARTRNGARGSPERPRPSPSRSGDARDGYRRAETGPRRPNAGPSISCAASTQAGRWRGAAHRHAGCGFVKRPADLRKSRSQGSGR